jgi:hypothetical protein
MNLATFGLLLFVSFMATRYAVLAIIVTYYVARGY